MHCLHFGSDAREVGLARRWGWKGSGDLVERETHRKDFLKERKEQARDAEDECGQWLLRDLSGSHRRLSL